MKTANSHLVPILPTNYNLLPCDAHLLPCDAPHWWVTLRSLPGTGHKDFYQHSLLHITQIWDKKRIKSKTTDLPSSISTFPPQDTSADFSKSGKKQNKIKPQTSQFHTRRFKILNPSYHSARTLVLLQKQAYQTLPVLQVRRCTVPQAIYQVSSMVVML